MLVFRDSTVERNGAELLQELCSELSCACDTLAPLFRVADVETSLEDAGSPAAGLARRVTDHVADSWAGADLRGRATALRLLAGLPLPARLRLKRPEGYAFYNVDPLRLVRGLDSLSSVKGTRIRVIGIRSIGTSLSACVRAELARRGAEVERLTVRPTGHPWDRKLDLSVREREFVNRGKGATFIVTDEGPGLSGSTLLAVAESLVESGVSKADIALLSTHPIVADRLVARDAVARFAGYRTLAVPAWSPPAGAIELSGGAWRSYASPWGADWPATWPAHERIKYLDPSRLTLHKFSGFSPYGDRVLERAELLAAVGFSPGVSRAEPGFLGYKWLGRRALSPAKERHGVLDRIASYLAFRARELRAESVDTESLEGMVRTNLAEAFGLQLSTAFRLETVAPIVADGRLQPHEWVRARSGKLLKTDAAEHGDDHFFPGPTDSAWDVAGAITEWELDAAESAAFCERYHRLSGDDVAPRLCGYLLAYAAWRLGVADFAKRYSEDVEQGRWQRSEAVYRARLREVLAASGLV
jgi:hypothetical protein